MLVHRKEPLAISMREAARLLGVSPRTVAKLVALNELPSTTVGRRRIIPMTAIERLIASSNGDQSAGREDQR